MTIGDVLAVIGGVIGLCVSVWAMLLASVLTFGEISERGKRIVEETPYKTLAVGGAISSTAGVIGIVLLNQANGLLKLIGWLFLVGLLGLGAVGGSGVVLLLADRIRNLDPRLSPFSALARGAGLLVVSGLVPIFGWFFVIPFAMILSFGVGLRSLRSPRSPDLPDRLEASPQRGFGRLLRPFSKRRSNELSSLSIEGSEAEARETETLS